MTRITWGTRPAAFLAIECMKHNAGRFAETEPAAVKSIQNDSFVDDLVLGAESVDQLEELCERVVFVMKAGGFKLAKWMSPHLKILHKFLDTVDAKAWSAISGDTLTAALGIGWDLKTDCYTLKLPAIVIRELISKRNMLSDIASIFDPPGHYAPVTHFVKVLFQLLWADIKLEWDTNLIIRRPDVVEIWSKWVNELPLLQELRIQRAYFDFTPTDAAIHTFSDASESGFGAVTYIAATSPKTGQVESRLVMSKTRVAPRKSKRTIARLELMGAKLGVELALFVVHALPQEVTSSFWTDSSTVLAWLSKEPVFWDTFVANRVSFVQEHTESNNWHFIRGADNSCADAASRGVYPSELPTEWFIGPSLLRTGW